MAPPPPASALIVVQVTRVARVTGATPLGETLPNPNQTDRKYQLFGTDLGILWDCGQGEVMAAFGDSYGRGWGGDGGGPGNADWRSNVLALSRDDDPAKGLVFTTMTQDRSGHAKELIASRKDDAEATSIPTGGITVGTRHYMTYMSVHRWGLPGLWRDLGKTVLFVTHDLDEAAALGDRCVVFSGRGSGASGCKRSPGTIHAIVPVPLPPGRDPMRLRADPVFQRLTAQLWDMMAPDPDHLPDEAHR